LTKEGRIKGNSHFWETEKNLGPTKRSGRGVRCMRRNSKKRNCNKRKNIIKETLRMEKKPERILVKEKTTVKPLSRVETSKERSKMQNCRKKDQLKKYDERYFNRKSREDRQLPKSGGIESEKKGRLAVRKYQEMPRGGQEKKG